MIEYRDLILGIESSCDDTAAAVVDDTVARSRLPEQKQRLFSRLSRNCVDCRHSITIAFRGPNLNDGNGHDGNGCFPRQRRLRGCP